MADRATLKGQFPDASDSFLDINADDTPCPPNATPSRVKAKKVVADTVNPYKRHDTFKLDYPGCVITEDNCYGRNGKHTYMKPEAREWQNDLIALLKCSKIKDWKLPIEVKIEGEFKNDKQSPDTQNMKIVYDTIKTVIGIDDKYYYTRTVPPKITGTKEPFILITISEVGND